MVRKLTASYSGYKESYRIMNKIINYDTDFYAWASLKPQLLEAITQAYPHAVELASDDTGFLESVFPEICPYSQEQILTKGFFPEPD